MTKHKIVRVVFLVIEALLLAATLALAALWIARPNGSFDGLALLSGAALGVLEWVRRLSEPDDPTQKLQERIDALSTKVTGLLAQKPEQTLSTPTPVPAGPPSDPLLEQMQSVIALRSQILERMNSLAKLKGISIDQRPTDIAAQLTIPAIFKNALSEFLSFTDNLRNESVPMLDWAIDLGNKLQATLDMFIRGAKTPTA